MAKKKRNSVATRPKTTSVSPKTEAKKESHSTIIAGWTKWEGPLPPPSTLNAYNNITPGLADKIIEVFEKQANHRMRIEKEVIFSRSANMKRGQNLAFIIALVVFFVVAFCAYLKLETLAGTLAAIDIGGLVSVFCVSQYSQKEERREREKRTQSR